MSTLEKIIQKLLAGSSISYNDAEKILFALGFKLKITSSHHIFRKLGHNPISIKKRPELLTYQIKILEEVLLAHGWKKK